MEYAVFFILELVILFLLSQALSRMLSRFLLRITHNTTRTIQIMSFFFLPGVIVHELAHWFVAGMLLVPTGEMEFVPQIQGNTVKLGSVAVGHTDPLRRFFIGVAPVLVGLTAMFGIFAYFSPVIPQFNWQTGILIYLFFEVGNTMFSSKKDMEGTAVLLLFLVLIGVLAYFLGLRINIFQFEHVVFHPIVLAFFQKADIMLLFPLTIDILLCLPSLIRR